MTFLNLYKSLYSQRSFEIAELAERMDSGLEKLQEASTSVSKLKQELFVMEKDLKAASAKAETVSLPATLVRLGKFSQRRRKS
jgi:dynein heavy chain